jgi:3-phosphoshikimate 1-carboxyvinyltransferase
VRVNGLHRSSRQGDVAFLDILTQMGCTVRDDGKGLEVIGPAQLHGVDVNMQNCSDVAQTLAAIAPLPIRPPASRVSVSSAGKRPTGLPPW